MLWNTNKYLPLRTNISQGKFVSYEALFHRENERVAHLHTKIPNVKSVSPGSMATGSLGQVHRSIVYHEDPLQFWLYFANTFVHDISWLWTWHINTILRSKSCQSDISTDWKHRQEMESRGEIFSLDKVLFLFCLVAWSAKGDTVL